MSLLAWCCKHGTHLGHRTQTHHPTTTTIRCERCGHTWTISRDWQAP